MKYKIDAAKWLGRVQTSEMGSEEGVFSLWQLKESILGKVALAVVHFGYSHMRRCLSNICSFVFFSEQRRMMWHLGKKRQGMRPTAEAKMAKTSMATVSLPRALMWAGMKDT